LHDQRLLAFERWWSLRFLLLTIHRGNTDGTARQKIFLKREDYEAFIRILSEGLEKYPVELFAFTLMPNHWHLVLRPSQDGQMGKLLRWITATHSLRYHGHYRTRGESIFISLVSEFSCSRRFAFLFWFSVKWTVG